MRKFPFYKQLDSMRCGASCLRMICSFYNANYSIERVDPLYNTAINGISLLKLEDMASKLNFETACLKVSVNDLENFKRPIILHWNQNHFVVLYNIKKNTYYIADPGKGLIKYSKIDFLSHWAAAKESENEYGIILDLYPSKNFNKDIHSNRGSNLHTINFLSKYINKYRKYLILIALGLSIGCILQLIFPFLTQSIVDIGIKNNDINFILLILLGELMIVIGRTATDFIRRWLLLHISMRINISLISDFFIKLLKLPMSFFEAKLMGALLQRINDHTRVQSFLTNQTLNVLFTLLSFLVFGIVLIIYNITIFCIFIIGTLLYTIWISSFLRKRKYIDYQLFEQQAINQNRTYQFITSMQEIKLQDCEQRRRWEWEDTQADLFNVQMESLKLQQTQEAGSIFINEVKNIMITVIAATSVINGHLSLGAMLAIQYIVGQLNSPVEQLMGFIYSFQDVKISLERINEIHNSPNEEKEQCINLFQGNKSISIKNIEFKYNRFSSKKELNNISFEIPEGKVTAIVGASGSGKTTLIKLILGFYPALSGEICIAGRDINEYNLKWWRRHCGVVMQDGVIFSESIARNIAVGDGVIDMVRLEKAARIANIHNCIMELPLKYNTLIGRDGVGLSQGQKQRILIARAVYKNPDFIFLDEATNALDAKNERAIVGNLDEFYKGRTVVVVAHRLSTVKNADQIIVLDGGKVVEIGIHSSLIEKKGAYYNLVKNQLELGN